MVDTKHTHDASRYLRSPSCKSVYDLKRGMLGLHLSPPLTPLLPGEKGWSFEIPASHTNQPLIEYEDSTIAHT